MSDNVEVMKSDAKIQDYKSGHNQTKLRLADHFKGMSLHHKQKHWYIHSTFDCSFWALKVVSCLLLALSFILNKPPETELRRYFEWQDVHIMTCHSYLDVRNMKILMAISNGNFSQSSLHFYKALSCSSNTVESSA